MKVTIVIPVFNEEKTIRHVIDAVLQVNIPSVTKEVIIVNDASTDNTEKEIEKAQKKYTDILLLSHDKNKGKGAAVVTGMSHATGEYIIIQDADLEYDPRDIARLLNARGNTKDSVVYGTRLNRLPHLKKEEKRIDRK